ncbi:DNA-binding MarR family transcriptional regulator [Amycolatopsis bartoniae]|uniref:MarR family transcriptional regulator n=1 Tax=Amycolatopsis bartoniae TaxID=941986 RepID=A0A8H9IS95_9PSEU|nr:MarR family transcriptional regulator [Amycolatopsis bartoniae]MBB2937683.1 DNA-binding MarR family transcriptional regulator [Amycolatopsis bartoniae]TVT08227.1 MarR family transcriptional regulator [Amycolatopsis bartoniae]GHF39895.1 MarR family transcriptional regulator [Amycolatopsis bartoniae]
MTGGTPRDRVDILMDEIPEHSEAESTAKALAFRLRRVAHRLETELRRELAAFGIELWELELLGALKRAGPPYRLSAGALLDSMRVTSGGVTKRVAGLERKGWVRRETDPDDRRQILVGLTETGLSRAKEVFGTKTQTETRLLSALSPAAQRRLNDDLRRLLVALEGAAGN